MKRALVGLGVGLPLLPLLGLATRFEAPSAEVLADAAGLLGRTLLLAALVTSVALVLGTLLAWAEHRGARRFGAWWAAACLLPLAIPSYVLAASLRHALGPSGPIGRALGLGPFTGLGPTVLTLSLATIPFVQLLVGAALARLPAAEEEAARTLGAARGRVFGRVVFPRLRPALARAGLLCALYVISDFGAVAMLDYPALTWRLFRAVNTQRLDLAVGIAGFTLLATLPLLATARALHGGISADRGAVANLRPPARRPLGALRWLVSPSEIAIVGLGLAVPTATMIGWLARAERVEPIGAPLLDTIKVASIGAALTLLLAATPAWVAARAPRGRWVEHAVYASSALPGVLLAFGFLLAGLAAGRALGGDTYRWLGASGALLYLGYAGRFLAEAFSGLETAFRALDPRQEESARVLGASTWARWRRVVGPAVAPGAAVAALVVLVAIVKELPITLMLGGAMGLRTLSFRMFDRYQDAFLADAGAAGLALLLVAVAAVLATLRWRKWA